MRNLSIIAILAAASAWSPIASVSRGEESPADELKFTDVKTATQLEQFAKTKEPPAALFAYKLFLNDSEIADEQKEEARKRLPYWEGRAEVGNGQAQKPDNASSEPAAAQRVEWKNSDDGYTQFRWVSGKTWEENASKYGPFDDGKKIRRWEEVRRTKDSVELQRVGNKAEFVKLSADKATWGKRARSVTSWENGPHGSWWQAALEADRTMPIESQAALDLVDLSKDVSRGAWKRSGKEIISERAAPATVQLPVVPGQNYRLEIEFTKKAGTDPLVILPIEGKSVALQLSGWDNSVAGIQQVDGEDPTHKCNQDSIEDSRWAKALTYGNRAVESIDDEYRRTSRQTSLHHLQGSD